MSKAILLFGLVMFAAEVYWLYRLERKYKSDDEPFSIEEFISRASLEDMIKARHHTIAAFLAIGLATIGSLRLFK